MGHIKSFREFICENESSWNNRYGNMRLLKSKGFVIGIPSKEWMEKQSYGRSIGQGIIHTENGKYAKMGQDKWIWQPANSDASDKAYTTDEVLRELPKYTNVYYKEKMSESDWTIRKTYLPAIDDNLKEDGTFDVMTSDMVGGGREIAETNWNVEVVQDYLTWFEAIATITHTDNPKYSVGDAVEIEIGDNDSIDDIATTIKSEYERTNGR